MKILITGTHCTGKSTLLNELKKTLPGFKFIGGVTREAKKFGLGINKDGNDHTQLYCACKDVINLLQNKKKNVVYDRSIIDSFVYTLYLLQQGKVLPTTYNIIKQLFMQYKQEFDYIFWLRPEFEIVDDNVRDTDTEFQAVIDIIFDEISPIVGNFNMLTGTTEERITQIKKIICQTN